MQVTIPLTITLELADQSEADQSYDATVNAPTLDYIADVFDMLEENSEPVVAVCGKTKEQIRAALASKL